jgi:putative oxidoreductase
MGRVYTTNSSDEYDLAKLILRVMVGAMMLFHGIDKVLHGVSFIEHVLVQHHLPKILVYGVYVGEVLAPIMLIIGMHVKLFAFIIVINMLFAIYLVSLNQIMSLGAHGAWALEVQAFYLFSSFAIMLLGPGRIKLG